MRRNTFACLILGAYQIALDRTNRGGDFLNWSPLPLQGHVAQIRSTEGTAPSAAKPNDAVRQKPSGSRRGARASLRRTSAMTRAPFSNLLLRYAVSEDGSLHAEKVLSHRHRRIQLHTPWPSRWPSTRCPRPRHGRVNMGGPRPGMAEAKQFVEDLIRTPVLDY